MERIVYITLHEKEYPLCCSLGALEEIEHKYGNIEKFGQHVAEVGLYIDALAILMKYGAARVKRHTGDDVEYLTREDIAEDLGYEDIQNISDKVWETMSLSMKNEIAGKSKSKKKSGQ